MRGRRHWKISVVQSPPCSRTSWRAPARRDGRGSRGRSRDRPPSRRRGRSSPAAATSAARDRTGCPRSSRASWSRTAGGRRARAGASAGRRQLAACVARLPEHAAEPQLAGETGVGRIGDVVLAQVAVQPVREVQEAVVHRDDEVRDQPGHRERPALELDGVDLDHLLRRVGASVAVEVPQRARQRGADEALVGVGVVQPADFERHQPGLAQLERLLDAPLAQVPEVQAAAVAPGRDVVEVEAGLVGVRLAELGRDQHVLARLVPEVVVERRAIAAVLPAALDLERPSVQDGEAAGAVAVRVAEHADHDVVAGHAVDGVRPREPGLADQLLRLDHVLDPRPAGVVADVDDVHRARIGSRGRSGASGRGRGRPSCSGSSRSDAVRPRRSASAARGDAAVLGIDDGEEVGLLDAGALVQARDVQELLGRRAHGLRGGGVEGSWAVAHVDLVLVD